MRKNKIGLFNPKTKKEAIKKSVQTNQKNETGLFDPQIRLLGTKQKGGKMNAYVLFEIGGIFQQMTLGQLLKS